MYFEEFMPYKKKIMQILISDEELIRAINPEYVEEPDMALWQNIYPMKYVPDINENATTYITISMFAPKINDNIYKEVRIGFHIFAHINLQKMSNGYCRTDFIQSRIDRLFNRNSELGIGLLELRANNELYVNDSYFGSTLWYEVTNFNSLNLSV